MPSTRWKKAWLLVAVMLLFFPCIFLLMEVPTEAKILKAWSTSLLWKIQEQTPEYREVGVWFLRQRYSGLSDREMIQRLESDFSTVDTSAIRTRYRQRLENIHTDQALVVLEAIGVYSSVVILLYPIFGFFAWLFAKLRIYHPLKNRGRARSG